MTCEHYHLFIINKETQTVKLFLYIPFISLTLINSLFASTINGSMDCKIIGQNIITTKEGKYSEYNRYQDGLKVGDPVTLEYQFDLNNGGFVKLYNKKKDAKLINHSFRAQEVEVLSDHQFRANNDRLSKHLNFHQDHIRTTNGWEQLYLSRYDKNDWSGMHVSYYGPDEVVDITAVNCRHTNDSMDMIFKILNTK